MKKLAFALLLFLGTQLQAVDSQIFEDHDLGIAMKIPDELSKNWEISHTPTGAKLDIYHSDKKDEKYFVLVLGKLPLASTGCERVECLYPALISQIQATIGEDSLFEDEDLSFEIIPLDHKIEPEIGIRSYRLRITDIEEQMTMPIDIHVFYTDEHALLLLTAVYPWMDEMLLTGFSERLIETVHVLEPVNKDFCNLE